MPQQVAQGGGLKKEDTTTNISPPPVASSSPLAAIDAFSVEEKLKQNVSRAALSTEQLCQGEFRVEPIPDPTGQKPAATISFSLNGRELFTEVVHTLDQESMTTYEFAKIHFRTCAGLLRKTLMGMSGGVTSADLIVPYQGTFKTLQLEEWADIQDLDDDRADELLVRKLALGYECVDGASRQYWTTIYHYDSTQGRLVEVSEQFPEFYTTRVKDYQKALQEIERSSPLSPQCRAKMRDLIAKAQRYTATSNTTTTTPTPASPLSPGWYEVIRSTSVREEPRKDAPVITRLSPRKRVYVVRAEGDYAKVESRHGKPPGYIVRKDLRPTQRGTEMNRLEEQRWREAEQLERRQNQEEARSQAEVARQTEIQRREEEQRRREELEQQRELRRSGERILRDLVR
jgi:hypothetical protein